MTLSILPDELVLEIAQYLAPDWYTISVDDVCHYHLDFTLRSLCAVNRRIRSICLAVLFRVLVIGLDMSSLDSERDFMHETVLSRPDITTLLRCASFPCLSSYEDYGLTHNQSQLCAPSTQAPSSSRHPMDSFHSHHSGSSEICTGSHPSRYQRLAPTSTHHVGTHRHHKWPSLAQERYGRPRSTVQ